LANSRKMSGRCVAGKEFTKNSIFEGWVRPVSNRPTEEITMDERRYENGEDPKLLDIISIQMRGHVPHTHQTENHLIDAEYYWVKQGTVTWDDLDAATEAFHGTLWVDGNHSYNGENDRIPEALTLELDNSLTLVEAEDLVIAVAHEGLNPKRKVRARFSLGEKRYVIAVTDPVIEREYLAKENGEYPIGLARLCISIGEPYQGYCYKLVAGIIRP
jgi:putative nucleic acid modification protein with dual OB domain